MATTIAERLLIKPNTTFWLSHNEHLPRLTPLPDGVRQADVLETASVAVVFADGAAAARETFAEHPGEITKPGVVWVAYPHGAEAGLDRDALEAVAAEFGLRAAGRAPLDDAWSGLRFEAAG